MKIKQALKIKSFRNPYEKLRIHWFYTHNVIYNQVKTIFSDAEITPQQFNVLKIISQASDKDQISSSYIKKRLVEKDADISRLVARLTELELIQKKQSEVDKRKMSITLTEKGEEMISAFTKKEKAMDRIFRKLDKSEVKTMNALLSKLRDIDKEQ